VFNIAALACEHKSTVNFKKHRRLLAKGSITGEHYLLLSFDNLRAARLCQRIACWCTIDFDFRVYQYLTIFACPATILNMLFSTEHYRSTMDTTIGPSIDQSTIEALVLPSIFN